MADMDVMHKDIIIKVAAVGGWRSWSNMLLLWIFLMHNSFCINCFRLSWDTLHVMFCWMLSIILLFLLMCWYYLDAMIVRLLFFLFCIWCYGGTVLRNNVKGFRYINENRWNWSHLYEKEKLLLTLVWWHINMCNI